MKFLSVLLSKVYQPIDDNKILKLTSEFGYDEDEKEAHLREFGEMLKIGNNHIYFGEISA